MKYRLLNQRLMFVSFVFLLLLSFPIIEIYDKADIMIFNMPLSFFVLFGLWMAFVVVLYLISLRIFSVARNQPFND